ncbi:MAG: hypothetical protein RLZZ187_1242 [Pseudomonadota bacterium]
MSVFDAALCIHFLRVFRINMRRTRLLSKSALSNDEPRQQAQREY